MSDINHTNQPDHQASAAALDFPDEQPKSAEPTPEKVAEKYAAPTTKTIPITERGSTVRVPAPEPVKDVVRTPEELMRANLEAPGHQVGDVIEGDLVRADCGLFQCGIDALGRVWRVEDGKDGARLVLAGWLNT
jgi:hypothetical protein